MATIVLSAAGGALGGAFGGSVLGLSGAVIGRAVGATLGRAIDERLLGAGSAPVETGRIDRFRLTGASEGAALGQVHGRMRVAGQVIWATRFREERTVAGGGKGGGGPRTAEYSYSVSLAIALCEGEITRVGRVWADGTEIARDDLPLRVYAGTADQAPDPKIEAVEGSGCVPAYRGTAYVVLEDLDLGPFGNRVPQFTFEVFRPGAEAAEPEDLARLVKAVALIPGTGEYALATTPVTLSRGYGEREPVNVNSTSGKSDFAGSLEALIEEVPGCGSVSLVVSWFGDDLRCGSCSIRPKVEQDEAEAVEMPWSVGPVDRGTAALVPRVDGSPVYGGTPCDASVIEAIRAIRETGREVMFYPFVLMDQLGGNSLPDPWTGGIGQPALPWRGRITTSLAPGLDGTPDGTAMAAAQVAAFFGTATADDFALMGETVIYDGPEDWSFRRFILHQAHLCLAAGGVDAFCIGSEMVALTQVRDGSGGFPAVAALRALAAEVRGLLGPDCRLGYAADWSEYHGYQPPGTADKLFHLDPLWADPAIDFIGIDNYMPLSDWRDGEDHADAGFGALHDLDYLAGNVAGGELYDWFYPSDEAREAQRRVPITDEAEGEPWVWRVKDLRGWWENAHHDRIGGVRQAAATPWQPKSKPIRFTELGCAAIDKGTNQPNKFLDPKSSESSLPYYSNGLRDDLLQLQYLRAHHRHWTDPENNPVSEVYDAPMLDWPRAHVWCWDARPFPAFPGRSDLWTDGGNYARGHWLTGRSTSRPLSAVVREICAAAGVTAVDTSRLHGLVRGWRMEETGSARAALQVLMLAYAFDAVERDGSLVFRNRTGRLDAVLDPETLVLDPERAGTLERTRASEAERTGRVRLTFVEAEGSYGVAGAEAVFADDPSRAADAAELPLALTRGEGRAVAERWLAEARVAREAARFGLPPSVGDLGAGDVVSLDGRRWRIDRVEATTFQSVEAVRIEPETWRPQQTADDSGAVPVASPVVPVEATFLDLPLLSGDEVPQAPHVAMVARPWPGAVALWSAAGTSELAPLGAYPRPATVGVTLSPLERAPAGLIDRGPDLLVRLVQGELTSVGLAEMLAGRNLAALGDGASDLWEVFQFAEAEPVGPRTWALRTRLRGQAGTDGVMPQDWPAGTRFVLLDGGARQIDLPSAARGIERRYRWGPAKRPLDDPSWREAVLAFRGIGLRPYAVCHLRAEVAEDGGVAVTWVRRTRIDGDGWDREVPLGEAVEAYRVRVSVDGVTVREATVGAPGWSYSAAARMADGAAAGFVLDVAQLSERFGPGPVCALAVG